MRKVVLAMVAALSALLAVPAVAAAGTLSSATPTYAWEGGPANGVGQEALPATPGVGFANVRCTAIYSCDNELLELKEQGTLTVEIKAGEGSNDLDVRLYPSDSSGTAPGGPVPGQDPPQPIAEDIRTEKDAKITVRNLKPGFYVAQVAFYNATNGVYNGTATLATAAPAAPAPAAPAAPAAPQQTSPTSGQNQADEAKRKKKLAACKKKAKKIKNKKKRAKATKACARKYKKKS